MCLKVISAVHQSQLTQLFLGKQPQMQPRALFTLNVFTPELLISLTVIQNAWLDTKKKKEECVKRVHHFPMSHKALNNA